MKQSTLVRQFRCALLLTSVLVSQLGAQFVTAGFSSSGAPYLSVGKFQLSDRSDRGSSSGSSRGDNDGPREPAPPSAFMVQQLARLQARQAAVQNRARSIRVVRDEVEYVAGQKRYAAGDREGAIKIFDSCGCAHCHIGAAWSYYRMNYAADALVALELAESAGEQSLALEIDWLYGVLCYRIAVGEFAMTDRLASLLGTHDIATLAGRAIKHFNKLLGVIESRSGRITDSVPPVKDPAWLAEIRDFRGRARLAQACALWPSRPEHAIEQFERTLEDSTPVIADQARFALGTALIARNEAARAVKVLATGLVTSPNDARLHAAYGLALMLNGQVERGRTQLDRARQIAPQSADIALRYSSGLLREGRPEASKQVALIVGVVIDNASATPEDLLNAARLALSIDDPRLAVTAYERAVSRAPGDGAVRAEFVGMLRDSESKALARATQVKASLLQSAVEANRVVKGLEQWAAYGEDAKRNMQVTAITALAKGVLGHAISKTDDVERLSVKQVEDIRSAVQQASAKAPPELRGKLAELVSRIEQAKSQRAAFEVMQSAVDGIDISFKEPGSAEWLAKLIGSFGEATATNPALRARFGAVGIGADAWDVIFCWGGQLPNMKEQVDQYLALSDEQRELGKKLTTRYLAAADERKFYGDKLREHSK